ncbi:MAG: PrsW family intramembrane metalloprotease [Myxococcota bacterium]|nr:PrsW family intramembrane metalloprotease [Myxococcota bacterium]
MAFVLFIASIFCATIPMFVFLGMVWWLDRYDREPIWLVVISFLWGGIGAVIFAVIGSLILTVPLMMVFGEEAANSLGAVLVAPLIEEPTKAVILLPIAFSKHFDNATDGFVYGAATGLGFAMTENFLYFMGPAINGQAAEWFFLVILRTLYSGVMHAAASSIWGAAIGAAKFRGWGAKIVALFGGYGLAFGMHALWNGLLVAGDATGSTLLPATNFILFPFEFLSVFLVFQWCLILESRNLTKELGAESKMGTLPPEHVPILASYLKRNRKGWLDKSISRDDYLKAVTTLAMRRYQANLAKGKQKEEYEADVIALRETVRELLGAARQSS